MKRIALFLALILALALCRQRGPAANTVTTRPRGYVRAPAGVRARG
jgi:hypothetical protein